MEIFKLFESSVASLKPGHLNTKDLRRDQLLDHCDEATKTLEILIKAKENELAYRRNLLDMLEKSKVIYDNKLMQAKQAYQTAKKYAPESLDLEGTAGRKSDSTDSSSTIATTTTTSSPSKAAPTTITTSPPVTAPSATPSTVMIPPLTVGPIAAGSQQSSQKSSDLDLSFPPDSVENRSSLDRRLSEFLKTFPNLTQAGLAPTSNNNVVKPLPGYYTQQPPPPPPSSISTATAPPLMAMMRFTPPPLIAPPHHHHHQAGINPAAMENHDIADMDLSDYEESSNGIPAAGGLIPMVASAMQKGAGGNNKHGRSGLTPEPAAYIPTTGQQYGTPVAYAPRLNTLPFDPSIMEPRLRDSYSSSGSRDKHSSHSDRAGSHRHSSSSGITKHGSDKKYSSSQSSRSKRR